jgi:hypothetical protein
MQIEPRVNRLAAARDALAQPAIERRKRRRFGWLRLLSLRFLSRRLSRWRNQDGFVGFARGLRPS